MNKAVWKAIGVHEHEEGVYYLLMDLEDDDFYYEVTETEFKVLSKMGLIEE